MPARRRRRPPALAHSDWYSPLGDLACVSKTAVPSNFDCSNPGSNASERIQMYGWDALERLS